MPSDPSGSRVLGLRLAPHALRAAVLHEVHARPFHAVPTPRRLLHFGFVIDAGKAAADRASLAAFCTAHGADPPGDGVRHHHTRLGDVALQWEQHSEFTTYTWEVPADPARPFTRLPAALRELIAALPQPGPHLVAADLHLLAEADVPDLAALFDPPSLAASLADDGAAIVATDFRLTGDGSVRLLVLDHSLTELRAGALTQRLLEIETYRTLALLGLPEAQRLAPEVQRIETALGRIANAMTGSASLDTDHLLLDDLTALAAALEADAVVSGVRFGASRAYDEIVQQRLATIREVAQPGFPTLAAFLARRMAPAMRTCQMLEARQGDLARKLARAANLLRTRVDVAIEQQNRDLLRSMNARTRLQLRLQQTVEGLSIAAISYYVVGLLERLLEGVRAAGYLPVAPAITTAISVPPVVIAIALVVRRIRRRHATHD
jgi:uncharacterized membrane-anchored protein